MTYKVLVVVVADVSVLWVEPANSWLRMTFGSTEQHRISALKVQHHRRPHVYTRRPLAATCRHARQQRLTALVRSSVCPVHVSNLAARNGS